MLLNLNVSFFIHKNMLNTEYITYGCGNLSCLPYVCYGTSYFCCWVINNIMQLPFQWLICNLSYFSYVGHTCFNEMLLLKPATASPGLPKPPAWPKHTQVCTQIRQTDRAQTHKRKAMLTVLHMKYCWVNIHQISYCTWPRLSDAPCNDIHDILLFCLWSLSHEIRSIRRSIFITNRLRLSAR